MESVLKSVHPFPARMAPSIILNRLRSTGKQLIVLDPMAGSGTTLVTARLRGYKAIGCDTDPLAVLMAQVWCSDIDEAETINKANIVLNRAIKIHNQVSIADAFPLTADVETREFIDYWYDKKNRKQLYALSKIISNIRDNKIKSFLWCAFSRMIITKTKGVSLGMDISHSRPHRVYSTGPSEPFKRFMNEVSLIIKRSPFKNKYINEAPIAQVVLGDSRNLPIASNIADIVITSPPYLNAIDYLRGHKLALVWMGHSIKHLRNLRSTNIGSGIGIHCDLPYIQNAISQMGNIDKLPKREICMLAKYVFDMDLAISEIRRTLKSKGKVVIVVGDSSIKGIFIRNSAAIQYLAKHKGFSLTGKIEREIPQNKRYMPPPNKRKSGKYMQSRMKSEVILSFMGN